MNGYERISRYKAHLMGIAVMIVVYGHLLYYHSGLMNYDDLNFTESEKPVANANGTPAENRNGKKAKGGKK